MSPTSSMTPSSDNMGSKASDEADMDMSRSELDLLRSRNKLLLTMAEKSRQFFDREKKELQGKVKELEEKLAAAEAEKNRSPRAEREVSTSRQDEQLENRLVFQTLIRCDTFALPTSSSQLHLQSMDQLDEQVLEQARTQAKSWEKETAAGRNRAGHWAKNNPSWNWQQAALNSPSQCADKKTRNAGVSYWVKDQMPGLFACRYCTRDGLLCFKQHDGILTLLPVHPDFASSDDASEIGYYINDNAAKRKQASTSDLWTKKGGKKREADSAGDSNVQRTLRETAK